MLFQNSSGLRSISGVDLGAALARQGAGFGFGQRLAFGAGEGEHHLPALAGQAELARLGKRVEHGKGLAFLRLPGFLDALRLGLEVGGGQALGDVGLQVLGHVGHALAQLAALARRQAQGAGAVGRVEVVQVAQVGRHGAFCRSSLHGLAQQRCAPAAHFAQHEQVVVGLVQAQAKLRSGLGALLADPGQGQVLQLGRAGKAQRGGVNRQPQLVGGEGRSGHQYRCWGGAGHQSLPAISEYGSNWPLALDG